MTDTPRYLITTADERTWKFDRPVLFLGEWCRLYDRKQVWEGMDAAVAEPYGLQAGQKRRDLAYVQALSSRLLEELADALNVFHQTRHSVRYWHILLGHWLQRYVAVSFNRYSTLEHALRSYEVSGTAVFSCTDYSLATTDSLAFIWATFDDVWDHVLCANILSALGNAKIEIDPVSLQGLSGFVQERDDGKPSAKRRVREVVNNILRQFSTSRTAFIVNSYLPRIEEVKLQLSLGQCPQLWQSSPLIEVTPDPEKRRGFFIDAEHYTGFERFVRSQLAGIIPSCYLEGYDQLIQQVQSLPWPTKPQFIFTSNNFDTDEIFKAWTGLRMEQGVPYFVGQHGNNSGTLMGSQNWPDHVTCDKFFTWGWTNESPKNVPAFIFKTSGRPLPHIDLKGGLLLIEFFGTHRLDTEDTYFKFGIYQEEQFRFVAALPDAIHQELTVRIHPAFRLFRWSDEQRWKDRSAHTHLEIGGAPIADLMAANRLVVHAYDSTGILETLALNIPTMCFWHGGLEHLLPSAKPHYELLRRAGILVDGPEQAAEMVAAHWDNVSAWWESNAVLGAREAFCARYARSEKQPVRTLKRLLIAHANDTKRPVPGHSRI
jgi:putative transferase (TIGR04331 family)